MDQSAITGRIESRISDIITKMQGIERRFTPGVDGQSSPDAIPTAAGGAASQDSAFAKMLKDGLEVNPADSSGSPRNARGEHLSNLLPDSVDRIVRGLSDKHQVSADLVRAIIKTESGGDPDAQSPRGAIGLMQLMPQTARSLNVNPEDPVENVDGGIRYLKSLARNHNNLDSVLAAYNAGPGNVKKYGGVPPYQETKNYIRQIRGLLTDTKR